MLRILFLSLFLLINVYALDKLKVGVLAYGTVNWELNVMKHHKLDIKNGFQLEVVKLASKKATSIALKANSVDIIVSDWLWTNIQRANNEDFTFFPYSKATGTLYIGKDTKINNFLELENKNIGIAGGPLDKTWLILRAYSKYKYKKDLKDIINPTFAAPPILLKKINDKSLDGAINFWHFNAKAKAKGAKEIISIKNVLKELGVKSEIPLIGWVFRNNVAQKNAKLYNSFLKASLESKEVLLNKDKEWDRIRKLMKAKDNNTFEALKEGYKKGAISKSDKFNIENYQKVFNILLKEGGEKLLRNSTYLDSNSFWKID